jgi:hypothetical protein
MQHNTMLSWATFLFSMKKTVTTGHKFLKKELPPLHQSHALGLGIASFKLPLLCFFLMSAFWGCAQNAAPNVVTPNNQTQTNQEQSTITPTEANDTSGVWVPVPDVVPERCKNPNYIQKSTPKFIIIGRDTLGRNSSSYLKEQEKQGYSIQMRTSLPNVITYYKNRTWTKGLTEEKLAQIHDTLKEDFFRVDFYNNERTKLLKSIDTDKNCPFKKEDYPFSKKGFIDMEYYKIGKKWTVKDNPKDQPVAYHKSLAIHKCETGYIVFAYFIQGANQDYIINDWKTALVIYNTKGEEVQRLSIDKEVRSVFVSEDASLFAMTYTDCYRPPVHIKPTFTLYDLKTTHKLYESIVAEKCSYAGIAEVLPNLLQYDCDDNNHRVLEFHDIKNRYKYSTRFTNGEWEKIVKNFREYADFFKQYKFKKEKF